MGCTPFYYHHSMWESVFLPCTSTVYHQFFYSKYNALKYRMSYFFSSFKLICRNRFMEFKNDCSEGIGSEKLWPLSILSIALLLSEERQGLL